jgi:5-methylcytosine-specific restriction endonuclease McrA
MNGKVLVLNQNYEPMSVCNIKKAIILIFGGKAELIEAYPGQFIHSVRMKLPMPSIVRLVFYVNVPYKKIMLTRKNILRRDNNRCQYCGKTETALTIDHIIPKSHGGQDTWENLVTACNKCNNKKANRTPEQAAMPLRRKPIRPNHVMFIQHIVSSIDDKWKPYLFMS